jgi:hypothetical protein
VARAGGVLDGPKPKVGLPAKVEDMSNATCPQGGSTKRFPALAFKQAFGMSNTQIPQYGTIFARLSRKPVSARCVYRLKGKDLTDTIHIQHNVAFIERRELSVVRQALKAMRDCINLKREIGLPVLAETREAILELVSEIGSLKLQLLRSPHQPEQLMLPGMPETWPGVKTRPSRTRNALNRSLMLSMTANGKSGTTLLAQPCWHNCTL